MSGLILVVLLAALVTGALRLLGLRGPALTLAGAALAFGAAGYALAGRPSLAGKPARAAELGAPPSLAGARHAMMGRFTAAERWLTIADGYASRGATEKAVGVLRSAVRARPGDYALWVGLGNALTDHARTINPAADLAFTRAAELAPGYPAPAFFRGLAFVRSGQPAAARAEWEALLAAAPADASWRPMVEQGLALLPPAEPR